MLNGKLVIIEGLDGSGKATQSALLAQALEQAGQKVMKISFPNYDSPACGPVKMYLEGAFGERPEDVSAFAASSFYAIDRYASYKTIWQGFYKEGGIIISDRYTTSNAVHQCCKLPREEWDGYLSWLFDFEYRVMGIPAPDQVVYLDMPVEVSQKLMTQRYQGDEQKKDIHERDRAYLAAAQQAGDYCAQKFGWTRIPCHVNQEPLSIQAIAAAVEKTVRDALYL